MKPLRSAVNMDSLSSLHKCSMEPEQDLKVTIRNVLLFLHVPRAFFEGTLPSIFSARQGAMDYA